MDGDVGIDLEAQPHLVAGDPQHGDFAEKRKTFPATHNDGLTVFSGKNKHGNVFVAELARVQ
jgi:hypothetical protein